MYIIKMYIYDNKNYLFIKWLQISLLLVFSIIIVGGLTRLTDSGLSITEWELFTGILPPLNDIDWNNYFSEYKKIPQYQLLNTNMTLSEFKIIFFWEYFHRVLARIIGIFFLLPLIYFHFFKDVNKKYIFHCYIILFLIILQGGLGWFMVISGLYNEVSVSHYRLSLHLTLAIIIASSIFWLILNLKNKKIKRFFEISKKTLPFQILIFIIFIQIILGAFVSGLDAGQIYQTWPLMDYSYFPNDLIIKNTKDLFNFNNHSLVQFYHRNAAYLILFYILIFSFYIFTNKIYILYKPLLILIFFTSLQIFFGVITLTSGLNIFLASTHQIVGVFLVLSAINLYYRS